MQKIFGRKYSTLSHRCLHTDRNRRYDNVDQLRIQWMHRVRPFSASTISIAAIIALIALPSIFYCYEIYSRQQERQHKEQTIVNNIEKLRLAFTRRQDRYTYYQIVPPYVSIASLKSLMRMNEEEILDAVEHSNEFRLVNLASTRPISEKPDDRFAVEHYPINRPYGCYIDRGSKVTIVSTSGWNEPAISNFTYYLAKIGGFNYCSREIGEIGSDSWFNISGTPTDTTLISFLNDITTLTSRPDSWLISLISANGSEEPTQPTQLHFTIGGRRGDENYHGDDLLIHNIARYDSLYQDISATIQTQYGLLSDLQRYHNSTSPDIFIRKLSNRHDIDAFILRISWETTCWEPRRIAIARTMAEVISRHLDPEAFTPSAPDLFTKSVGYRLNQKTSEDKLQSHDF